MITSTFYKVPLHKDLSHGSCGICQFPLNGLPYDDPIKNSAVVAHSNNPPNFHWTAKILSKIFGQTLNHYFHLDCIEECFKRARNLHQSPTCPLCRKFTDLLNPQEEILIKKTAMNVSYMFVKTIFLNAAIIPFVKLLTNENGSMEVGMQIIGCSLGIVYLSRTFIDSQVTPYSEKLIERLNVDGMKRIIPYIMPNVNTMLISTFLIGITLGVSSVSISIEGIQNVDKCKFVQISGSLALSFLECGLRNTSKLFKKMITIAGSGMIAREAAKAFGCSEMITTVAVATSTALVCFLHMNRKL